MLVTSRSARMEGTLASVSADKTIRSVECNHRGARSIHVTGYTGSVNSVVFSPDGGTLAGSAGGIWGDNPIRPLECGYREHTSIHTHRAYG